MATPSQPLVRPASDGTMVVAAAPVAAAGGTAAGGGAAPLNPPVLSRSTPTVDSIMWHTALDKFCMDAFNVLYDALLHGEDTGKCECILESWDATTPLFDVACVAMGFLMREILKTFAGIPHWRLGNEQVLFCDEAEMSKYVLTLYNLGRTQMAWLGLLVQRWSTHACVDPVMHWFKVSVTTEGGKTSVLVWRSPYADPLPPVVVDRVCRSDKLLHFRARTWADPNADWLLQPVYLAGTYETSLARTLFRLGYIAEPVAEGRQSNAVGRGLREKRVSNFTGVDPGKAKKKHVKDLAEREKLRLIRCTELQERKAKMLEALIMSQHTRLGQESLLQHMDISLLMIIVRYTCYGFWLCPVAKALGSTPHPRHGSGSVAWLELWKGVSQAGGA